ncbi:MAG TPA: retention module-containing protein, partial [Thiobacillus sp.]
MDTTVSTPQAVATVISVEGQAFARDPSGQMRPLKPGDILREGDTIVTMPGGQVQLAFLDGHMLSLLPNETFTFSAETSPTSRPGVAEASLPAGEAERIIQALERGENIDDLLDPTAAGLDGGGNNSGNSFVRLLRITEGVDPLSFQFASPTSNVEFPDFGTGTGTATPVTPTATPTPVVAGSITLTAASAVTEGGSIVYTASVDIPPQGSPLVLTLSNGQTITIPVGASSGTSAPVAVRPDDAYIQGNTPVTASVQSSSGGGYTTLALGSAVTTTVSDDADVTTATLSASASVAEGGNITYTATLTNPAQGAVMITLSNGSTITIADGASTGSVSVAAPGDDVYLDASTVSATIASATGGNFEQLSINNTPAVTSITDTIDTTTVSISGAGSVVEGANAAYTVSLTSPAQTTVTVNLSYSGTAADGTDFTGVASVTIPAGSSSAPLTISTIDDALYEGAEAFTVTIASATGGNFENLVVSGANNSVTTTITDNDPAPVFSVANASITEGGLMTFTVTRTGDAQAAQSVNFATSIG